MTVLSRFSGFFYAQTPRFLVCAWIAVCGVAQRFEGVCEAFLSVWRVFLLCRRKCGLKAV